MKKKTQHASHSSDSMSFYVDCCMKSSGMIHVVLGVGIGFLAAGYLGAGNLTMWGFILVGLGVLGHLIGKTK